MIQDLSGSWCIKGIGESMTRVDSRVPLMHHNAGKSWVTDPDPDHPKGMHPICQVIGLVLVLQQSKLTTPPKIYKFRDSSIKPTIKTKRLNTFLL